MVRLLILLLSFTGCGDDSTTPTDSGTGMADAGMDGAIADAGEDAGGGVDAGVDAGPLEPRRVIAGRIMNLPSHLPVGASTPALSERGAPHILVVYNRAPCGGACTADWTCPRGFACVDGNCAQLSEIDPPVDPAAINWTTSAPSFVSVDNSADPTRGVLTGLAPGMSGIGATYTDSFGTIDCTTWSSSGAPSTTTETVTVVPRMLCDIIVTTRPFDPTANPGALDTGATDGNRTGRSMGVTSGDSNIEGMGFARRRAYYPGVGTMGPMPSGNTERLNDPRVLIPNVSGLTQQFNAIGMFALDGDSARCSGPVGQFPLDVTGDASWDVTTAANPDNPNHTASTLTVDPIFTFSAVAPGLGTASAASTPDRIQAVRATINSGARFCTGNGTATGTRDATNSCRHSLVVEACGAVDTSANSVIVTGWDDPTNDEIMPGAMTPGEMSIPTEASNISDFPPGVQNIQLEAFAPDETDAAFYSTFIGDTSLNYYAIQRFTQPAGGCGLVTGTAPFWVDYSDRATWTSSNEAAATVDSEGNLTPVGEGMTSISATVPASSLSDSLDFRVQGAGLCAISATTRDTDPLGAILGGLADPVGGFLDSIRTNSPTFTSAFIDIIFARGAVGPLDLPVADVCFNNSYFECGMVRDGRRTVCSDMVQPMAEGNVLVAQMKLAAPVPDADTGHSLIYSLVMDSDGVAANDWRFRPPFDWDIFQGADRWYQLIWDHTMRTWRLTVTQVDAAQMTAEVASSARVVIDGDVITFFVNATEYSVPRPGFRLTAFGHDGAFSASDRGADVTGADPTLPLTIPGP